MARNKIYELWLKCKVTPGMFDNELGVMVTDAQNRGRSLFVYHDLVNTKQPINEPNSIVDGEIRVSLADCGDTTSSVELPTYTLEGPRTISVKNDALLLREVVG